MKTLDTVKIEEYGLSDFLTKILYHFRNGYTLDTNTNEFIPQAYGGFYEVTMIKPVVVEETKVEDNDQLGKGSVVDTQQISTGDVGNLDSLLNLDQTKVEEEPTPVVTRAGRPRKNQ